MYLRSRSYPAVLRIHSSKKKGGYEEYYAEMLLFLPWHDEISDLKPNDSKACLNLFSNQKSVIVHNRKKMLPFSQIISEIEELLEIEDNTRPMHISEQLDSAIEQENCDDLELCEPLDKTHYPSEEDTGRGVKSDACKYKPIVIEDEETLRKDARMLSMEQRIVFDIIIDHCKKIVTQRININLNTEPPLIIAHGKFNILLLCMFFL